MRKLMVLVRVACGVAGAAFFTWAAIRTGSSVMSTVICALAGGASLSAIPLALVREEEW